MNPERRRHINEMQQFRASLLEFFKAIRRNNPAIEYEGFIRDECEPRGITPDIVYRGALDPADRENLLAELLQAAYDRKLIQNPFAEVNLA